MESWNLYNSIDMTRMLFGIRRSSGWIAEVFSNDSIMWVDYHNGDIRIHADYIINGGSLVSRVIDDINAKLDLYEELSKKVARQSMLESADAVSPEVVLAVGNNDGHKAVVTTLTYNDDIMRVNLYARQYEHPVYTYFIYKDTLASEVIEDINKELDYLSEILNHKDELVDAEVYGLQIEVISYALKFMLDGDAADVAVCKACNEWDV